MANSSKKARVTDNRPREGFAKRLYELRMDYENNGLNAVAQENAAEKLSQILYGDGKLLSSKRISDWENGEKEPKLDVIVGLAKVFNTTCDYLLTGVEPERVDASRRYGLSNEALQALEELNSRMNLSSNSERNLLHYIKPIEFINTFIALPQIRQYASGAIDYALTNELARKKLEASNDGSAEPTTSTEHFYEDLFTIKKIMNNSPILRRKRLIDEEEYNLVLKYQLSILWNEMFEEITKNPTLIKNGVVEDYSIHHEWIGFKPEDESQ